jgi:hypothetical protein
MPRNNKTTASVKVVANPSAFQGWQVEAETRDPADLPAFADGDAVILDFGEHRVGRLRLRVESDRGFNDSPVRLKFIFAEVPAELVEPFDPFVGSLSRNWLQDEVVTFDCLPHELALPRRYAFRYVKIEAVGIRAHAFRIRLLDIECECVAAVPQDLAPWVSKRLCAGDHAIAMASLRTLRDCMQTVFEDGPKRDRRLWIGDLRLQALANSVSFRQFDMVRRCLYLFAAVAREDGLVPSCLYEEPQPHNGQSYAMDYPALFAATLADYVDDTGDEATGIELLPVAVRQLEILIALRDSAGNYPENLWWFIDWQKGLEKQPCVHGLVIWCAKRALSLARRLGQLREVVALESRLGELCDTARKAFVSPEALPQSSSGQVSWAAWAWLTMAEILSPDEARYAFDRIQTLEAAVLPGGPYLMHYCLEALGGIGRQEQALELMRSYWGGMLRAGLDVFPEVWDTADEKRSPYGTHLLNSYCHAWSCTPVWFLARSDQQLPSP